MKIILFGLLIPQLALAGLLSQGHRTVSVVRPAITLGRSEALVLQKGMQIERIERQLVVSSDFGTQRIQLNERFNDPAVDIKVQAQPNGVHVVRLKKKDPRGMGNLATSEINVTARGELGSIEVHDPNLGQHYLLRRSGKRSGNAQTFEMKANLVQGDQISPRFASFSVEHPLKLQGVSVEDSQAVLHLADHEGREWTYRKSLSLTQGEPVQVDADALFSQSHAPAISNRRALK